MPLIALFTSVSSRVQGTCPQPVHNVLEDVTTGTAIQAMTSRSLMTTADGPYIVATVNNSKQLMYGTSI